jgi:hypothetical protein
MLALEKALNESAARTRTLAAIRSGSMATHSERRAAKSVQIVHRSGHTMK